MLLVLAVGAVVGAVVTDRTKSWLVSFKVGYFKKQGEKPDFRSSEQSAVVPSVGNPEIRDFRVRPRTW